MILSERYDSKNDLIKHIQEIFKENSMGVCLSTVHKAKGLESENVYILCNSSMPSKLAVHDWEKQQEKNIMYVAYTRAKNKMGFISEKEIKPSGSLQDPSEIVTELAYYERKVCDVLGKEPMEKMESIELTRFKLQNMRQIEDLHKDDNTIEINTIEEKPKNNDDLLSDLEQLL